VFLSQSLPPAAQVAYGARNEFRRNPPLRRRDGEEAPFAWTATIDEPTHTANTALREALNRWFGAPTTMAMS
jgi:hypothetical protein